MITQTIRDAIMDDRKRIPGYIYVVRDGDVMFYVGSSQNPTFRLCQHLGIADGWHAYTYPREKFVQGMEKRDPDIMAITSFHGSQLGVCILHNIPESLEWSFDIYEQEDAITVVKRSAIAQALPQILEVMKVNWYEQRTIIESMLIGELKPYLNSSNNIYGRLVPEKYRGERNDSYNTNDQ